MAKYTSGKQKNLKVGISSYSENLTSLEVIGKVGIGTTNAGNKSLFVVGDVEVVGILTAQRLYSSLYGEFTGSIDGTSIVGTSLSISGISTVGFLTASNVYVSGVTTSNAYLVGATQVISSGRQLQNIASLDATTTSTIETAIQQAPNDFTSLNISGISTLQSTTLIGGGTSTGTAGQVLQVTGINSSVYIGGNTGIGTTNPTSKLQVVGDITAANILPPTDNTGVVGNTSFTWSNGQFTNLTINDTLNVRTAIDLADSDILRFGTSDDVQLFYNGTTNDLEIELEATANQIAITDNGTYKVVIKKDGSVGVGSTIPTSKLDVVGDGRFSGVVTATTFIGALTGIAASATQLVTPRTISISGDVVGSTTFDGTQNVSIAATIQPDSVGLGTHTYGDYVQSITGTSNQISVSATSGEGSTPILSIPNQFTIPQDATVTRDLQVNRNLNVTGNITIGGTSAVVFSQSLNIFDPDIVLGFRTDAFGNDVSNDNTANHGGVALASTEGTPLVQLFIAGIETNPATYKKIMWFKAGTFAGLGTDAWLSNYAVGIGSTQFPTGTRLAAGSVQFTENDLAVVRNINASGIVTTLTGNLTTANITTGNIVTGIVTTISGTTLNYTGIGTIATLRGTDLNYSGLGTVTTLRGTNLNYTGIGTIGTLNSTTGNITTGNITTGNIVTGIVTTISGTTLNYTGIGTVATLNSTTANVTTGNIVTGIVTTLSGTTLDYTGIGTIATLNSTTGNITTANVTTGNIVTGIITTISGTTLNYTGIGTIATLNSTNATLTNINASGVTTIGLLTATNLYVSGVGTFLSSGLKIRNPANTFQYNITGGAIAADRTLNLPVITGTDTVAVLGLSQTFSAAQTFSSTLSATAGSTINFTGAATGNHVFATNQTSGTLTFGGTSGTGTITLGRATTSQITNIQAGASGVGTTKTINFGTGGDVGSFTNINIGSATTDANSNILISGVTTFRNNNNVNTDVTINTSGAYPDIDFQNAGTLSVNGGQFLIFDNTLTEFFNNDVSVRSKFSVINPDDESLVLLVTNEQGGTKNVGIGTSVPTEKLWVNGNGYFTGIVTATQVNADIGTITSLNGTNLNYSGVATANSLSIGSTQVISSARQLQNIASLDAITTATIESAIQQAPNDFNSLNVSGISTLQSTTLIGGGTSTGTTSQRLQVTGGAYVSGNLGIGTTIPQYKLDVVGSALIRGTINLPQNTFGVGFGTTTANPQYAISQVMGDNDGWLIYGESPNGTNTGSLVLEVNDDVDTNEKIVFRNRRNYSGAVIGVTTFLEMTTSANIMQQVPLLIGTATSTGTASQPLQVTGGAYVSGNLGIGTTNPTSKLHVVGDTYISGILTATDINSASDIRLKTNIKPFENTLEKIVQINGVSFNWIENNAKSAGIIAQDVEKVFPELVNDGDHKTVNYNGLIGVLVESIKELKQEVEDLKSRLPET